MAVYQTPQPERREDKDARIRQSLKKLNGTGLQGGFRDLQRQTVSSATVTSHVSTNNARGGYSKEVSTSGNEFSKTRSRGYPAILKFSAARQKTTAGLQTDTGDNPRNFS
jgi:hypothetical protein